MTASQVSEGALLQLVAVSYEEQVWLGLEVSRRHLCDIPKYIRLNILHLPLDLEIVEQKLFDMHEK